MPPSPKKRRVSSDPGEFETPTHSITAEKQLSVLGRVFHDPCRRSSVLAEAWVKVGREVMEWDGIDGEALEWWSECSLDRSQVDAIRISARMQTEALARACLREQGVPSEDLVCSDIALMLTHPGDGEQCVHFDVQNYEDASRCYAFILYCSDGRSTAVPESTLAELREAFTDGETLPPPRVQALLHNKRLSVFPVSPGSSLLFRCDLPHKAVEHLEKHNRYAAFAFFHPRGKWADCKAARFPLGAPH
jgi:hypothetical protein